MSFVVDASMTLAWLLHDERSDGSQAVLRRVSVEGATVPSIWRLEVGNALRSAVRRRRCTEKYADDCLRRLEVVRIAVDSQTNERAWKETWALARDCSLTVYDAAYLELAARLQCMLATRDAVLLNAARKIGLETLSG